MAADAPDAAPPRRLAAVAVTLGALGLGAFVLARAIDVFWVSLALQVAWFVLVSGGALLYARGRPGLLRPIAGALVVTGVAGGLAFFWTSARDVTVNEHVVTGVRAAASPPQAGAAVDVERAAGTFASLAHDTTGRAAVVDLAGGGRRLTLTGLRTANGPDLRVYVVPGGANGDGGVDGGTDLGALKGNIGTQQYDLPGDVPVDAGASVVIWCRAFTVAFGAAQLERS